MLERKRDYVLDTVTLSNFALAGRLELLVLRYGRRVRITPEVLDEVSDGAIAGYSALNAIEKAVAAADFSHAGSPASTAERAIYRELLRILAPGEASCIAYAKTHGAVVVTDDRTARECCGERGVTFIGTIGILKACCLDGTLSAEDADATLQAMIDAGFYSPVRRISDLV